MGRYAQSKPPILMPDPCQNNDWQFENPIVSHDFDTEETTSKKLFEKGDPKMTSEPKNRTEEIRGLLPMDKLEELLRVKPRHEICKEYGIKSYELANTIAYYKRNEGFVAPAPVKAKREKPVTVAEAEVAATLEPEKHTPVPEQEHAQCTCNANDTALLAEVADLREEVERLKKIAAAVQAFSYHHRHQIAAGHYSEWGVAD